MHGRKTHIGRTLFLLFAVVSLALATPVAVEAERSSAAAAATSELRAQYAAFFQGGMSPADLAPAHELFPLRRTPLWATTAWLLLADDPGTLEMIYPGLARLVTAPFERPGDEATGLLQGSFAHVDGDVLSPAVNGLLSLELRSLALVARRVGRYEDALELLAWSRDHTEAILDVCFDPEREGCFPRREDGSAITAWRPEQLLPLLTAELGERATGRLVDRFIATAVRLEPARDGLWAQPVSRPALRGVLRGIRGMTAERMAAIPVPAGPGDETHQAWATFWREAPAPRLRPAETPVLPLDLFRLVAERESLFRPETGGPLASDLADLVGALGADALTEEDYTAAVWAANRLLSLVSRLSAIVEDETHIWKMMDENAWRHLSPRTSKLLVAAAREAAAGLMAAKADLTTLLERGTSVSCALRLPDGPVPIGAPVELELVLRGGAGPFPLRDLYLQAGTKRWRLDETAGGILGDPNAASWTTKRGFAVPPGSDAGLLAVPWFVDARRGESRIELHGIEILSLSRGCAATIDFPRGRRLTRDELPVTVAFRYAASRELQGTVDAVLPRELATSPELPARFRIRADEPLTTLPLAVTPAGTLPPGVYPVEFSVRLQGRIVALFEETLVRPLSFFSLGPFSDGRSALRGALEFQDDLLRTHSASDGRTLAWREVPPIAYDTDGGVRIDRLAPTAPGGGMVFYSIVDAPGPVTVAWTVDTADRAAAWVNGARVLEPTAGGGGGTTLLRSGRNAILVSVAWRSSPAPLLVTITDGNGYPVADLGNELDLLVDGFERLASAGEPAGGIVEPGRPREKALVLRYPDAASVNVIGTFNNWRSGSTPMTRAPDGVWTVDLQLLPGRYAYKFVVDGELRLTDPSCGLSEPDGFGGFNSVIVVD